VFIISTKKTRVGHSQSKIIIIAIIDIFNHKFLFVYKTIL